MSATGTTGETGATGETCATGETWDAERCSDVVDHIYEYVDGEVTAEGLAAVRAHLRSCPPCLEQVEVQVALKALVRRCCLADRAPAHLRVRIMTQLVRHDTSTVTTRVTGVRLLEE